MKLKEVCQDCKGSGQYVGLCSVDSCKLCDGVGYFEETITLDEYISNCYPENEFAFCETIDRDDHDAEEDENILLYEMWLDGMFS